MDQANLMAGRRLKARSRAMEDRLERCWASDWPSYGESYCRPWCSRRDEYRGEVLHWLDVRCEDDGLFPN